MLVKLFIITSTSLFEPFIEGNNDLIIGLLERAIVIDYFEAYNSTNNYKEKKKGQKNSKTRKI